MKLKLWRKNNDWISGVYRGKGGVSSLVCSRKSKSLWKAIGVFNFKNIKRAIAA